MALMKKRQFSLYDSKSSPQDLRSKTVKILNIILIRMYWDKNMVGNKC